MCKKEERARGYAQYNGVMPGAAFETHKAFWIETYLAGYTACESIKDKEIEELQDQLRWRSVEEELSPMGEEVLFYRKEWVNEDFNPKGTRIGFRGDEDYTTAYWWNYQDCYMTISHSECDDNPSYSEKTKSTIEPTHWLPIPRKEEE